MEPAGHIGTGHDVEKGTVALRTRRLLAHIGIEVDDLHGTSIPVVEGQAPSSSPIPPRLSGG
jgi:hypothetical protein